jgi:hypothetical protein
MRIMNMKGLSKKMDTIWFIEGEREGVSMGEDQY